MRQRFFRNAATFLTVGQLFNHLSKHHERRLESGPRARHQEELDRLAPQVAEAKRLLKSAVFNAEISDLDIDVEIEEAFERLSEDERMKDVIEYVLMNSDVSKYASRIREFSLLLLNAQGRAKHGVYRSFSRKNDIIQGRVQRLNRGFNPKVTYPEPIKRLAEAELKSRLREIRVDDADTAAAFIHEKYPWMREANVSFLNDARRDGPFRVRPMILAGNPGSGKTSWAKDLSRISGAPFIRVDLSASGGGLFELQGQEHGWAGSQPGQVVRGIADSLCVNPVIVVEEVDMGGGWTATGGRNLPGACAALMSMIEPETAKAWKCPSSGAIFDLRGISWILTSNHPDRIPAPLLDRCQVVNVPDLSEEEIDAAAWRAAEEKIPGAGDTVVEAIREGRRYGAKVRTLRGVRKAVEALEAVSNRPTFH